MSLSALPTALVVPPVNLLLSAVAGVVLARYRRRMGSALLIVSLAGLMVLSLPVVSTFLEVSLEQGLPFTPPADDPPQAIVILSADAALDGENLQVGTLTLERERAGATLYRRTKLPVLVTGGPLDTGRATLAGLMVTSLSTDFQVPVRWVESASRDTRENASLSAKLLRQDGIRSIYLVTHAWHMKRALMAFAGLGITVTAAPVRRDARPSPELSDFIPHVGAWHQSYYALHEWIGCAVAYAAARGWGPGG